MDKEFTNNSFKQMKIDIPQIEINDAFDSVTGSRVIRNVLIHTKNGIRKYRILRTGNEKYVMQI
jgi:hypothetical protein